jgi:hypothetical protein
MHALTILFYEEDSVKDVGYKVRAKKEHTTPLGEI